MSKHLDSRFCPLVVSLSMQRIEEAYNYYPYDSQFGSIVRDIVTKISGCNLKTDKNGKIIASSSVIDTIKNEKDDEFYNEMIDAIIRVGDKFYKERPPFTGDADNEKKSNIYGALNHSPFDVWYGMAKRLQ